MKHFLSLNKIIFYRWSTLRYNFKMLITYAIFNVSWCYLSDKIYQTITNKFLFFLLKKNVTVMKYLNFNFKRWSKFPHLSSITKSRQSNMFICSWFCYYFSTILIIYPKFFALLVATFVNSFFDGAAQNFPTFWSFGDYYWEKLWFNSGIEAVLVLA